jgi:hypothetical protein
LFRQPGKTRSGFAAAPTWPLPRLRGDSIGIRYFKDALARSSGRISFGVLAAARHRRQIEKAQKKSPKTSGFNSYNTDVCRGPDGATALPGEAGFAGGLAGA